MLSAVAACLAPFSGEKGNMGQIEGKAEESAGCCFREAATPTHIIQIYHSYLKHSTEGPHSMWQPGSSLA